MTEPVPTPRYEAVLKAAANIARELDHPYVGVEHLFLAIINDENAIPAMLLGKRADIQRLAQDVYGLMNSPSYTTREYSQVLWEN